MVNPITYPHRFSKEYLEFILSKLENVDELVKEATLKPEERKKCIRIDFCGLAATNLLGIELRMGENTALRRKLSDTFKNLLKQETLNEFSNHAYLKVRFCFSYLYSDFVTSLIKAEKDELWKHLAKKEYLYHNNPLERKNFTNSRIYKSQTASLAELSNLIVRNKDLIPVAGRSEHHSLQIRFAAIPSSLCLLIINDTAIFDSYLYAQDKNPNHPEHISLLHPVAVLNAINHKEQFDSFRDHWKYLWMHDLTLFCGDATEFKKDNPAGIKEVNSPDKITWSDKVNRMKNDTESNYTKKEIRLCKKKWRQELRHHTSRIIDRKNIVIEKVINNFLVWLPLIFVFYGVSFFIHFENVKEHILFAILMASASLVTLVTRVLYKWIKETYLSE